MRVLVACEYSGVVRDAFIRHGHEAISCDLLPSDSDFGPHYQGDVFDIIHEGFDLMIAHPPCTYLCSSGLHWNKRRPERVALTEEAIAFVKRLWDAPIRKVAIENPIGCLSTRFAPPRPDYSAMAVRASREQGHLSMVARLTPAGTNRCPANACIWQMGQPNMHGAEQAYALR